MMNRIVVVVFLWAGLGLTNLYGQEGDTAKVYQLNEVQVSGADSKVMTEKLPEVSGMHIYAGKKNEVLKLSGMDADLSINNPRQVLGKVPGLYIWENDGSGIQTGVATRGLSPNRSWEFNMKQNGYDMAAEPFGYPEAYFTPPLEAVQQIEVIRGSGSLQYGPQFGGMINYQLKKGDPYKALAIESQQTIGSNGLFNSFQAIGGTKGKLSYYGYMHHRNADGWRENSRYRIENQYISIQYRSGSKFTYSLEWTRSHYISQQPGGLTDSMFNMNHQLSVRSRNWLAAPWNVGALKMEYQINSSSKVNIQIFTTLAARNSVGYTAGIHLKDSIHPVLLQYQPRQLDRDNYRNIGMEAKFLTSFSWHGNKQTFTTGFRLYQGTTLRKQLGIGTSGDEYHMNITPNAQGILWGRNLTFTTNNGALYAEQLLKIGKRFSVVPGIRMELIQSAASGYYNAAAQGQLSTPRRNRFIPLFGAGAEFKLTSQINIYSNLSQAYRPVTYSEMTPSSVLEIVDPNLRDASGYNADLGIRGKWTPYIQFDVSVYYLKYDQRIGTILQNGVPFRTNIGTSVSKGMEGYFEMELLQWWTHTQRLGQLKFFASVSYNDSRYVRWDHPSIVNDPSKTLVQKRVENAPKHMERIGLSYRLKRLSISYQWNSVGEVYTDASNTVKPNISATVGKLEGYRVSDLTGSFHWGEKYQIKAGVNNLMDVKYATRRATGYPGPGLLPANGRTIYISFGAKF